MNYISIAVDGLKQKSCKNYSLFYSSMFFYVCIASKSLSELSPPIGTVLELNLALYV